MKNKPAKPNKPTGLFHATDNMSEEDGWRFWFGDDWEKEKEDWEKNYKAKHDRHTKQLMKLLR